MKKYNIEGGIDFFNELYKSLDIEENEQKTEEDNNLCLITNQPLTDKFIEMSCGHKFNYLALFNDIKNHKQKFNSMEGHASHLKTNEIRCPYCRCRQTGVLPYYEELGLQKINGVNSYDPTISKSQISSIKQYVKCEFFMVNPAFDPSGNNPIEKGNSNSNCKFLNCCNYQAYQIKNYIQNYDGEINNVCYLHKNTILSQHKKDLKEKEKIEKIKIKEEIKKAKEEAKQKQKEDVKKAKEEAKQKQKEEGKKKVKIPVENVVLGPAIIDTTEAKCIEILKSGPNKGKTCGLKVVVECYCKRHMKNTENTENTEIIPQI